MSSKKQWIATAAILGVISGLAVTLFVFGYFSGTSKKVPVLVVTGDKTNFEDPKTKHERRFSVVRISPDLQIKMEDAQGLEQLTRYKNEKKTLFAIDTKGSGGMWSEDMVIGFADGGEHDTKIFYCTGRTKGEGAEYTFYSTFDNCWGPKKTGRPAGFTLHRISPGILHMAVFSCLSPEANRYLSLNPQCESPRDTPQEMLGFVRAATILVNDPAAAAAKEAEAAPEGAASSQ